MLKIMGKKLRIYSQFYTQKFCVNMAKNKDRIKCLVMADGIPQLNKVRSSIEIVLLQA